MFRLAYISLLIVAAVVAPCWRCCCASEKRSEKPAASCCEKPASHQHSPVESGDRKKPGCPCEKHRPLAIESAAKLGDAVSDRQATLFEPSATLESLKGIAAISLGVTPSLFLKPAALYGRELLRVFQTMRC